MIWVNLGTLSFREVFERIGTLDETTITVIALLLFAGAVGKSAQFPLHVWLPDAMEGPTPVSPSSTPRRWSTPASTWSRASNPIFVEAPTAMWVVAIIGTFTAIFAAAIALTQNDIKKVLAYSTVSQLAYMFLALGIGAWVAAIFHLVSHGFFKGLLFMGSGSVIHGAGGEQDMRFMGNLRERMRWTYWTMVIGSLALAGIPLFAGFFSKDEILAEAFNRGYFVFYAVGRRGRLHDRVLHVPDDLHDLLGRVARAESGLGPRPRERPDHGRAARHPRRCRRRSPACCWASRPRAA